MALPPGYEINPETGKQRKICGPDEYRDPVTKKCKKINPSVRGANLRKMPDNPQLSMPLLGFGDVFATLAVTPQGRRLPMPGMYKYGKGTPPPGRRSTYNSISGNKFGKKCKHNSFGKCLACAAL
jgi:hypothetical protein